MRLVGYLSQVVGGRSTKMEMWRLVIAFVVELWLVKSETFLQLTNADM